MLTGSPRTASNFAMALGDQSLTLPFSIGDPSAQQGSEMYSHTGGFLGQPPSTSSEVHQELVESDWVRRHWQMREYDHEVAISSQDTELPDLDALEEQGKWTSGYSI